MNTHRKRSFRRQRADRPAVNQHLIAVEADAAGVAAKQPPQHQPSALFEQRCRPDTAPAHSQRLRSRQRLCLSNKRIYRRCKK